MVYWLLFCLRCISALLLATNPWRRLATKLYLTAAWHFVKALDWLFVSPGVCLHVPVWVCVCVRTCKIQPIQEKNMFSRKHCHCYCRTKKIQNYQNVYFTQTCGMHALNGKKDKVTHCFALQFHLNGSRHFFFPGPFFNIGNKQVRVD